jgi:hypothetical protein
MELKATWNWCAKSAAWPKPAMTTPERFSICREGSLMGEAANVVANVSSAYARRDDGDETKAQG